MAKSLEQLIEEANYWRAKEGLPPLNVSTGGYKNEDDSMARTAEEIIADLEKAAKTSPNSYSKELEKFKSALEAKRAEEESATTEPDKTQEATSQIVIENEIETQLDVTQPVGNMNSVYQDHLICGAIGFLMGVIVAFLYFRIRIKKIKVECETRVNEARASLDKMISVIAKE